MRINTSLHSLWLCLVLLILACPRGRAISLTRRSSYTSASCYWFCERLLRLCLHDYQLLRLSVTKTGYTAAVVLASQYVIDDNQERFKIRPWKGTGIAFRCPLNKKKEPSSLHPSQSHHITTQRLQYPRPIIIAVR
jgi:hypothetical protein